MQHTSWAPLPHHRPEDVIVGGPQDTPRTAMQCEGGAAELVLLLRENGNLLKQTINTLYALIINNGEGGERFETSPWRHQIT
jgi:hypothetical protein